MWCVADAASVAGVALRGFNSQSDPEVVILEEGTASSSALSPAILDDRFNQLDELDSQSSPSILPNCGSGGAPSYGEFVNCNQISADSNSSDNDSVLNLSPSILANCGSDGAPSDGESVIRSQISSDNLNLSNSSSDNDSVVNLSNDNVNCYGSVVVSGGAHPGSPSVDSVMSQASDLRKWPISESSSDDVSGGSVANSKNSKSLSKKSKTAVVSDTGSKDVVNDAASKKVSDVGSKKVVAGESRRNVTSSVSVVLAKRGGDVTKKLVLWLLLPCPGGVASQQVLPQLLVLLWPSCPKSSLFCIHDGCLSSFHHGFVHTYIKL